MYGYIYQIKNIENDKVYVGQTIQAPKQRKFKHLSDLRKGKHHNAHLQRAYDKYGESSFSFTVLSWFNSQKELDNAEKHYISLFECLNKEKGYNLTEGGSGGKLSPETKEKLSKSKLGKLNPMYGKYGKDNPCFGRKLSDEHKKKISKNNAKVWLGKTKEEHPNYGIKFSEARKKRLSESMKGEKNHFYGKKHSKKSREKISNALKGRGLFGFIGVSFKKGYNPEKRCWNPYIRYNNKNRSLGMFEDPLSGEIVHNIVVEEYATLMGEY